MSFRSISRRYFEPGSQALMVLGIVALCQPWSLFLHRYGVSMILVGLIGFMITGKIGPEPNPREVDAEEREGQA